LIPLHFSTDTTANNSDKTAAKQRNISVVAVAPAYSLVDQRLVLYLFSYAPISRPTWQKKRSVVPVAFGEMGMRDLPEDLDGR
jgi:hypothetical protein